MKLYKSVLYSGTENFEYFEYFCLKASFKTHVQICKVHVSPIFILLSYLIFILCSSQLGSLLGFSYTIYIDRQAIRVVVFFINIDCCPYCFLVTCVNCVY